MHWWRAMLCCSAVFYRSMRLKEILLLQQQQRRSLDHEALLCVCHFGVFTCCFWFVYGFVTWPHMLTDALSGLSGAGRDALRFATVGGTQWEPDR